jgi:chaperonin cofactor prefoldin
MNENSQSGIKQAKMDEKKVEVPEREQKPREFWIMLAPPEAQPNNHIASDCLCYHEEPTNSALKHLSNHVIEYKAYDQLLTKLATKHSKLMEIALENDKLRAELERLHKDYNELACISDNDYTLKLKADLASMTESALYAANAHKETAERLALAIEALEKHECTKWSKENVTVHQYCSCDALTKLRGSNEP